MDFVEREAAARRRSIVFSLCFVIASAATVASVDLLAWVVWALWQRYMPIHFSHFSGSPAPDATDVVLAATAVTALVMGGAILQKSLALAGGGAAVAELLEGTALERPADEPLRRQLLDVVDEMAVAASLPLPAVYLLEREDGINAFVAGFAPESAVLCVTRGALDVLARDELQAVVAHELSHVVNGDMALNARLTVQLQGLIVFSELGRKLVDFGFGRGDDKGQSSLVGLLGLTIMGLGSVGGFFGSLFKGAVSGERELLADAEAVQFTRNPAALLGAFKKIGGPGSGGEFKSRALAEVNNFLFVEPCDALGRNPFLLERIRALEPDFDGRFPTTEVARPRDQSPANTP
jgi:Zn-dependent protease with chaperone function